MPADLHTHSEASSDSLVTIGDRVELARDAGIDAVAVTDHCAVNGWFDAPVAALDGVTLIAGVELNPCRGEFGIVHVLGLFVDPDAMGEALADREEWAYGEAIDDIHAAGGIAVLAHPGRYDVDLDPLVAHLSERGLDGIEVEYPYGAYTALAPAVPHTPPGEIERLAEEHGLLRTGGSDCHGDDHEHMGLVSVPDDRVEAARRAAGRDGDHSPG